MQKIYYGFFDFLKYLKRDGKKASFSKLDGDKKSFLEKRHWFWKLLANKIILKL